MHIDQEKLEGFMKETLSEEEYMDVLLHLSNCDYCGRRLANLEMGEERLSEETEVNVKRIQAPSYLKEQILEKSHSVEVQTEKIARETSKRAQLFFYGLKTMTAVAASIVMIFGIGFMNTGVLQKMTMAGNGRQQIERKLQTSQSERHKKQQHQFDAGIQNFDNAFQNIADFLF